LRIFDAIARFDSPKEAAFIRVAEVGGRDYLDLGDVSWQAVEFTADGWRIIDNPMVRFHRSKGMLSLPPPVRGGRIEELKKFLNLRTTEDWVLFITDVLAALFSRGPYPVLALHGEAGSAKTTVSRIHRKMIDPNESSDRAMPRDIRDLMILARNSWVLPFDNLSYLPPWFSDCLCRLSTGGGFSTRELYTNSEEVLFEGQRPVILNGIEELATRTDLVDRCVLLDLPVLQNCREEREFWKAFDIAHPRLLGALLNVAVETLRSLPSVQLKEKPRMADFAVLGTAAETALGLSRGAFMNAYEQNRQNANAVAMEASPIANLTCDLAEKGWNGTAESLLRKLSGMADEETRKRKAWPKTPRVLSGMLRRLATALRRAGVTVELDRDETRNRNRLISIEKRRLTDKKAAGSTTAWPLARQRGDGRE